MMQTITADSSRPRSTWAPRKRPVNAGTLPSQRANGTTRTAPSTNRAQASVMPECAVVSAASLAKLSPTGMHSMPAVISMAAFA